VLGILAGGVEAYAGAGFEVASQRAVPAERVVEDLELGGAVLVDVRDDEDWVRGHVPGSLHIPLRSVAAASALLPRTPILVACADGSRAATAASMLRRTGHADIWRIAGAGVPYLLSRRLNLGGI
jgi:rhodanese-related sulfurtransferase